MKHSLTGVPRRQKNSINKASSSKENETLNEFSSRFMELVNQMKSYGEEISDRRIVEKLLIYLLNNYDLIMVMVEETKDLSLLSV